MYLFDRGGAQIASAHACARLAQAGVSLIAAAVLTACGGGGEAQMEQPTGAFETAKAVSAVTYTSDGRAQMCADHATYQTPVGELLNDMWNVGGRSGSQCIQGRWVNGAWQYGWTWNWPMIDSLYSYPHIRWGASPWAGGPTNDTRFPRAISATPRMNVSFDITTTGNGKYTVSNEMWLMDEPTLRSPTNEAAIKVEFMVWTDVVPANLGTGTSVKIASTVIDGRNWDVWTNTRTGTSRTGQPLSWKLIAYHTPQHTQTISYDARKLMQDAINRGLMSSSLYIGNIQLGNEIISGAGSTWVRDFKVTF